MFMPRRANQTSFKPGHKPSPETLAKRKATIAARVAEGTWGQWSRGRKVPEEEKQRRAATRLRNSIGNGYIKKIRGIPYRVVTTERGQMYEHRYVMEKHLGRRLERREVVHHINHDTLDNRIDNLELTNPSDHNRKHAPHREFDPKMGQLKPGQWSRHYEVCVECGKNDRKYAGRGLCWNCYQRDQRRRKASER